MEERMQILRMVEAGQISTEEALRLLDALNGTELPGETDVEREQETPPSDIPDTGGLWLYPTIAGAVVMAVGAPLMALGFTGQAAVFWAVSCGWIPFFIGLFILTLGAWSRGARWFYLRISNARSGKRSLVLGFPLPLTLAAWVLKIVRSHVPQLEGTGVDETILALCDGSGDTADDLPVYIDVLDDDDGEHVQIYIG